MKKVKIMLLSLLVLAVVGGALAFKANTKFSQDFCTTPAWQDAQGQFFCTTTPGTCPLYEDKQPTNQPGQALCTTTPNASGDRCGNKTQCVLFTRIIND